MVKPKVLVDINKSFGCKNTKVLVAKTSFGLEKLKVFVGKIGTAQKSTAQKRSLSTLVSRNFNEAKVL